jgi:hypothetical protein
VKRIIASSKSGHAWFGDRLSVEQFAGETGRFFQIPDPEVGLLQNFGEKQPVNVFPALSVCSVAEFPSAGNKPS